VAPYTVVGGNPAKVIRKRFTDEQVQKLLEIQWWNWDIERITANVHHLTGDNLEFLTD
jgi:virginiamycin A acetyltransferase